MASGWRDRGRALVWMQALIVLVVLGVASAIVRPRMSRGAGAPPDQPDHLLIGHLRSLRSAILSYAQDHRGQVPSGDSRRIERQLLEHTDIAGQPSPQRVGPHLLGPYLRELPCLPVGIRKGLNRVSLAGPDLDPAAGWVYDPSSGSIRPNTEPQERDPNGIEYRLY